MAKEKKKDANTWAMLCHLTALSLYVGVPFGHIIVPLIIWLIKKDEFAFVDEQGKESLNFQISITIYGIVAGLLCLIAIGVILLPVIAVAHIVLTIMAAVKANQGEGYHYPFTLRFIK
ncbi:DUF4870 domain-containing protein [candidate division WOR-3 bacterium]|nr:DUF4870 domain-containing protein [candidate division WOR-3 bacterium]